MSATDYLVGLALDGKITRAGECWEWTGYRLHGYGQAKIGDRSTLVHRHVLALALGRPLHAQALHRCDNPPCVRPSHLYEGTVADNMADRDARGRNAKGETHGFAKLTEAQVVEIRRRHIPGFTRWQPGNTRALAVEFGICKFQVTQIANRRSWRSVA